LVFTSISGPSIFIPIKSEGWTLQLAEPLLFEDEDDDEYEHDCGLPCPPKLALAERLGDRYCPLPRESDLYGAVR